MAVSQGDEGTRDSTLAERTPVAEFVAGGIGLLLTLFAAGVLVHDAVTGEGLPPDIGIEVTKVVPVGAGHVVIFTARNRGDSTAAQVRVAGVLHDGVRAVETAEAIIDFVPDGSESEGGLFFREDPRRHRLEVRATGFARP